MQTKEREMINLMDKHFETTNTLTFIRYIELKTEGIEINIKKYHDN